LSQGRRAAYEILSNDEDMGAGNPAIIREAAQAARRYGDEDCARELEDNADAWDRYIANMQRTLPPNAPIPKTKEQVAAHAMKNAEDSLRLAYNTYADLGQDTNAQRAISALHVLVPGDW
jgi:hypothetical protein